MVMPYHLHMPSYFLETFTEYPNLNDQISQLKRPGKLTCLFHTVGLLKTVYLFLLSLAHSITLAGARSARSSFFIKSI